MKIVVPIKQVAALDDEFELLDDGSGVDPDFLEFDLNEWDAFSLEAALQLREGSGEGEVVVVTVGDEEAEEALLGCLARGRRPRVADLGRRAGGGRPARGRAGAGGAQWQREAPDLVLCGVQSSDAVNGATGIALAGYLEMPHVAVVKQLDYDAADSTVTVERELEGGLVEVLRVALAGAVDDPDRDQRAALREPAGDQAGAGEAAGGEHADSSSAWTPAALAAAAGSRRRELKHPERGEGAEMLDGSPAEVAARIVEIVQRQDERMSAGPAGGRRDATGRAARGLARADRRGAVDQGRGRRARCWSR